MLPVSLEAAEALFRVVDAAYEREVVRIVVELRRRSRWVDGQTVTGSAIS